MSLARYLANLLNSSGQVEAAKLAATLDLSSKTLTYPDNSVQSADIASLAAAKVSGQLADANMSPGSVIQVQNIFFSTIISNSTRTFVDISGFNLSITPRATSSKILILGQVSGVASTSGGYEIGFRVTRNGTSVGANTNGSTYTAMSSNGTQAEGATTTPLLFLDSPNTTSALTYQVQWIAGEAATYYLNAAMANNPIDNNSYFVSGASSLMLLEIAG